MGRFPAPLRMRPLKLNPLPTTCPSDEAAPQVRHDCDFVEDSVIFALLAGPVPRHTVHPRPDVAFFEDARDYAGWTPLRGTHLRHGLTGY
jgi:hypothetical protein